MEWNEEMKLVARAISEQLPNDLINMLVEKSLREAFRSLQYGSNALSDLVGKAVMEKANELIRTKYADAVNKRAEEVALRAVAQIVSGR